MVTEVSGVETKSNEIALIVHCCDNYALLYKGFEFFFSKYWDINIKCNYYFATEEKDITIKGFKNIHSGKGEWADRLTYLLKEKITEPYIIYFQEDMWLKKKTNPRFFDRLFEIAVSNKWQQLKLHSSNIYTTVPTGIFIEGFNIAKVDNRKSDFLMSHQVTLWKKDFFLSQLFKKEHPWRNERRGTKRLKKLNPDIFQIDYFAENGHAEINENDHPVLRSEYRTISVNGILNSNVEGYISELKKEGGMLQEYALKLEHNYLNQLTHDGKPRPRKTDIFKRTKNWLNQ